MAHSALEGRIGKVAAIVLREGRAGAEVLVFDHPLEEGGFMVQVPAGTIEPGEAPDVAVMRELLEETGVNGGLVALADVQDEEWEGEKRRRWVYLLHPLESTMDAWDYECDCGAPIVCHWLPFEQAEIVAVQQAWLQAARAWVQERS
jgi:8-oxo-dGTP pyrophosphatase MutT (NUDIX family)